MRGDTFIVSNSFGLARYNTDGSLDTSFDVDGKVTTDWYSAESITALALQSDGRLVAVGGTDSGISWDMALIRYNVDGSLYGVTTTDFGGSTDAATSVAVQADGKIVVAGYSGINGANDFALVRYNVNGSLDTSFDTDGKVTTAFGGYSDVAQSVILQADGKIVVAGSAQSVVNGVSSNDIALVRYNTDGSLDSSFGIDGKVVTDVNSGSDDFAESVILQADGKIVVTGTSYAAPSQGDFVLIRYNSDGSLDSTFDGVLNHAPTGAVTINDTTPEENQVLTVSNTLADADGLGTISYAWLANGLAVGTGNSYTVAATDIGKKISVAASYTDSLGHAESLSSTATSAVTLAKLISNGTADDDLLVGNTGNDVLNGNAGNDLLDGDIGNDTLNGGDGNDLIHGDAGNDSLIGGTGNDLLYGGVGNDIFNGGAGNDVLRGGIGKDIFIFNTSLTTAGVDTILDFKPIDDTIKLENAVFTALTKTGVLNAASFVIGADAVDSNDFLIYNNTSGALSYDADGNGAGAAVQIALIGNHATLTNADFLVI